MPIPGMPRSCAMRSTSSTTTVVGARSRAIGPIDARYVVDPAVRKVHVAVALSATNHLKDTKTHRYYFDRSFMAVPPGTTGFKVTSSGVTPARRATLRATWSDAIE